MVEVEAISFDAPSGDRVVRQTTSRAASPPRTEQAVNNEVFVQVGAFGSRENAQGRLGALRSSGIGNSFVLEDTSSSPTLYRVRIGPIKGVIEYDILVEELENRGINDPYLVTE